MLASNQTRVKTFSLHLDRPYGLRIHWHLENYPWIERTIRSAKKTAPLADESIAKKGFYFDHILFLQRETMFRIVVLEGKLIETSTHGAVRRFDAQDFTLREKSFVDNEVRKESRWFTPGNFQSLVSLSLKTSASRSRWPSTMANCPRCFFHRVMIPMIDLFGPQRINAPRPRTPVRPIGLLKALNAFLCRFIVHLLIYSQWNQ